jgi:CheY-like chemotaxis protein
VIVILIVDDHLDSCEALKRLLERVGYRSQTVASGEEALGFIRAVKPKLLVLDVMMPGLSGLDVLRTIRGDPELTDIPVMMYTALDTPEAADEAYRLGAQDYIPKSRCDWTELLGRINDMYDSSRSAPAPGPATSREREDDNRLPAAEAMQPGREASRPGCWAPDRREHIEEVLKRARGRIERTKQLLRHQRPPPRPHD